MEPMFWVWLGVIAVSLIIEIVTMELVSVWFSIGGVVPFILSSIGGVPVELQVVLFVVISALLIIFIRKYAQKFLFKNMNEKTNLDALVGKQFKLLEDIDIEKNGSVKVNGVVWTAATENNQPIKMGEFVEVVKVEGNKLIVKEVKKATESSNINVENEKVEEKVEEVPLTNEAKAEETKTEEIKEENK